MAQTLPSPLAPKTTRQYLNQIPGDLKAPILGDTLGFLRRPVALFEEKRRQYGDVFKVRLFGQTVVFLIGTEANKFLLIEQAKYLSSQKGWENIDALFHDGLMLKDGANHQHHRSIMQSAFRKESLKGYMALMMPKIAAFLAQWQGRKQLTVFPEMKKLTLFLAGKVFFGLDFSEDLAKVNQAIIRVVKASTALLPFKIPFTTYWYGIQGRKVLEQYFQRILAERRQQPTSDILGELCLARNEEGAQLSDEDIINHLIFLLMAAHDTTASTLTSLFYELAAHPEWQEKLREESIALAQTGEMRFERLAELKYLDLAIKETLRLHTPLIMIPRKTTQTLEFGAYTLPPDTALSILIHHHHYEGQIFEQAQQFDPMRFAEERAEHKKCPHAYVPFGGGKHHCIGYSFAEMQIKLVMHQILLYYKWTIAPGYQMVYRHIPIQEPKDGLPVMLSAIEQPAG